MFKIGFIQGRLSESVGGKIQAFPWSSWELEFSDAAAINLNLMEWTIDQDRLYENPIMTSDGQEKIRTLSAHHNIYIPSITCDCFMQAPFWKSEGWQSSNLKSDFLEVCRACASVGVEIVVVPLVDNGRIEFLEQENNLIDFLIEHKNFFINQGLKIAFESDYAPPMLARFIERLPYETFGINYDTGNSASLGYNPIEEFYEYGSRVLNVHIKDRKLNGGTVPLGAGDTDFDSVFMGLAEARYQGNFILQTARSTNGDHINTLKRYRNITIDWLKRYRLMVD
jgi:hexulose-6-phosphate isomerase